MCDRLKQGLKAVFYNLLGPRSELEDYLQGSQNISEIERREREWASMDHSNFK